jgi:hypothetical protein
MKMKITRSQSTYGSTTRENHFPDPGSRDREIRDYFADHGSIDPAGSTKNRVTVRSPSARH